MNERPQMPDLFARIASEQDAALATRQAHDDLGRAQVERMVEQMVAKTSARASRQPVRRAATALALTAGGALAVFAVVYLAGKRSAPALEFEIGARAGSSAGTNRVPGATGAPIAADARSELPLRFSDGSTVTFRPGSRGRVDRLHGGGAEILVEDGRLEAVVIHAEKTRWVVRAGPYAVRVTGTRFAVDWHSPAGALAVDVREGSVVVDGGVLGPGVALRAGQRLSVEARQGHPPTVRSEPIAVVAPETAAPAAPSAAAAPPPADADDWRALAATGSHHQALRAAQRVGLGNLRRRLDARGLLALGDVARFAAAPDEARRAFEALVHRFPDDRLAGDAVFSLGRLAIEADRPRDAAQWFARYVQKWPDGALAEQAGGRLLEAARAGGDPALIERAAAEYLRRNPDGPLASLARASLAAGQGQGDDGESPPPSP
jgi:ferric-dicitrate binding protein FerR (iron transport regulator)